ncbi:GTPase-associated protein 1-related protein [Microlunatus capsulatus]|uniref:Uncharacterized protein n=1 Tax=Microlunatus capsulatus TaxID=99117 RepID=A0ABS4Z820_9ACTN|nr:GTPase-associated protein 1-related protein [Microlunatus capsulatus]MBP2417196.1 hypothetical protein [Microlunatus capsulatus]
MIGRLEYTSCDDGLDGIGGFQVRAMSPGIRDELRTAAIRDSIYEPSPGRPSAPTASELTQFPRAFGYTRVPGGSVVFRSTYVGRDHTGRWGNYFAQALTFDSAAPAQLLPIDLWESPAWAQSSERTGVLASVNPGDLVPGMQADLGSTMRFLQPQQPELVASVIQAVLDVFAQGKGRVIMIVSDSTTAALWISTVTRSLPASIAAAVSFTTYTARPESHQGLIVCTTPDVSVPAYGDFRLVDVAGGAAARDAAPLAFARLAAQSWREGLIEELVVASSSLTPPLMVSELDEFAQAAVLFLDLTPPKDWSEMDTLSGLEFAQRRASSLFLSNWHAVAKITENSGGITEVSRWSAVLRSATEKGVSVPASLTNDYLRVAVDAVVSGAGTHDTWLPKLDDTANHHLADAVLVPALLAHPTTTLLRWLGQRGRESLAAVVVAELARRLEPVTLSEGRTMLDRNAASFCLQQSEQHHRLRILASTVLASEGDLDPVDALGAADSRSLRTGEEWQELAGLLWPDSPPTLTQAHRLLRTTPVETLQRTHVIEQLIERLTDDAAAGGALGADHFQLVELLRQRIFRHLLSKDDQRKVDAVTLIEYFTAPRRDAEEATGYAVRGLQLARSLPPALVALLERSIATWLVSLPWNSQRDALERLLLPFDDDMMGFVGVYTGLAEDGLRASAASAASIVIAWRSIGSPSAVGSDADERDARRLRAHLLDQALPKALRRVRRRDLDRLGELLPNTSTVRANPGMPEGWQLWWGRWRSKHESKGLLGRLMPPREKRD